MGLRHNAVLVCSLWLAPVSMHAQSLAERLGYRATDRLLIINVNDAGLCHATNFAVEESFKVGVASSASAIIPSSWAYGTGSFAQRNTKYCFGIQLALTTERGANYAWEPVAPSDKVPSLISKRGAMYAEVDEVLKSARIDEVETEFRAQVAHARQMGITPYFFNSHFGILDYNDQYWRLQARLAAEYGMPVRFSPAQGNNAAARKLILDSLHVLYPDHIITGTLDTVRIPKNVPAALNAAVSVIKPGVNEIDLTPAAVTPELKSITNNYLFRFKELEWLLDPATKKLLDEQGIILISYKQLWDLQQKSKK